METIRYLFRDPGTGKFWNGDAHCTRAPHVNRPRFDDEGYEFEAREQALTAYQTYLLFLAHYAEGKEAALPQTLELVTRRTVSTETAVTITPGDVPVVGPLAQKLKLFAKHRARTALEQHLIACCRRRPELLDWWYICILPNGNNAGEALEQCDAEINWHRSDYNWRTNSAGAMFEREQDLIAAKLYLDKIGHIVDLRTGESFQA